MFQQHIIGYQTAHWDHKMEGSIQVRLDKIGIWREYSGYINKINQHYNNHTIKFYFFIRFKRMKGGQNMKIEESVKLYSWGTRQTAQAQSPNSNKQSPRSGNYRDYQLEENAHVFRTEEGDIAGLQMGFKKLKNDQITRLKDFKSEFDEIRQMPVDYPIPNGSRTSSMMSSSISNSRQEQSQGMLSPKQSKLKLTGGRQVQILQLEKKQLENMLENSMKKIQELLQSEMRNKKLIHELRLEKESKKYGETDHLYSSKYLRKKEKELGEQIRILELEREGFISTLNASKDKIQYLESTLTQCEKELRKILDEKRNYEELIRMEKDKYLNLELEARRERREFEIMEKDKNSEINRLLKRKDVKEGAIETEMKHTLTTLQEELKTSQKRYTLLLEQFQKYQLEKQKEDKEKEVKIINELLTKNVVSGEPQNKVLQQTITNILNRINDLEKKPIIEFDQIVEKTLKNDPEHLQKLQKKIEDLHQHLREKTEKNAQISKENIDLKLRIQKLERSLRLSQQNESDLQNQIQRLKRNERSIKRDKSQQILNEIRPIKIERVESGYTNELVLKDRISVVQNQSESFRNQISLLGRQREAMEEENRQLRLEVNKLEFEVERAVKQANFSLQFLEKAKNTQIQALNREISGLKQQLSSYLQQISKRKRQHEQLLEQKTEDIDRLKATISEMQKQIQNFKPTLNSFSSAQIQSVKQQSNRQFEELSSTIQALTKKNEMLMQEHQQNQYLVQENNQLKQLLRKSRAITVSTNQLWFSKQAEYEKLQRVIQSLKQS